MLHPRKWLANLHPITAMSRAFSFLRSIRYRLHIRRQRPIALARLRQFAA
jgi:hypothetical protein